MDDADVIVVGAGLAGLSATVHLQAAGLQVLLLEQGDEVGGRVRTDEVDGFLLDRGFQVLLPAYPELRRLIDLTRLDLQPFTTGVVAQGHNERWDLGLHSDALASMARFVARRPVDALAVAAFSLRDVVLPGPRLRTSAPKTTRVELDRWRVSEETIEEIFRPFLAGVFLDPELTTSSRMFHLVWRCFLRGGAAVPAAGMRRLPHALADLVVDGALACRPRPRLSTLESYGPPTAHSRRERSSSPPTARARRTCCQASRNRPGGRSPPGTSPPTNRHCASPS